MSSRHLVILPRWLFWSFHHHQIFYRGAKITFVGWDHRLASCSSLSLFAQISQTINFSAWTDRIEEYSSWIQHCLKIILRSLTFWHQIIMCLLSTLNYKSFCFEPETNLPFPFVSHKLQEHTTWFTCGPLAFKKYPTMSLRTENIFLPECLINFFPVSWHDLIHYSMVLRFKA